MASTTLPNIDATGAAAAAAGSEQPLSPSHAEEAARLEKLLQNRAEPKELQEKGILKAGNNIAPALQAAQAELKKHQLEDRLEGKLERRPERDELERLGILKDQQVAPALQGKLAELERSQLEDKLEKDIASRPSPEDLKAKGLLKEQQ